MEPMDSIVSLITPTHKTTKLRRLYESIAAQTDKRFEWVIIPNNGADLSVIPQEDWIRVVPYTDSNSNIGALKNFGFMQGQGELLAEVDHDDELLSNCVEKLIENKDKGDFIFSNNLVLHNDEPYTWGPSYGWRYGTFNYKGKDCLINIAYPPFPGNFSWQWWAPNHVRVWRKEFYHRIGGHDINLKACDDGDLMCRSMIYGTIHHINEVLYVYYLHPENTSGDPVLRRWIVEHSETMHNEYLMKMAMNWSKVHGHAVVANEDIFKLAPDSAGLIMITDLYKIYDPVSYMKKAYEVLVSGGILFVTNPLEVEQRYPFMTEKQISFWITPSISAGGVQFLTNGYAVKNGLVVGHFTKNTENLHLAIREVPDYSSILFKPSRKHTS
jgi:glycosyltransferase involved in cell wall biosynthesis